MGDPDYFVEWWCKLVFILHCALCLNHVVHIFSLWTIAEIFSYLMWNCLNFPCGENVENNFSVGDRFTFYLLSHFVVIRNVLENIYCWWNKMARLLVDFSYCWTLNAINGVKPILRTHWSEQVYLVKCC